MEEQEGLGEGGTVSADGGTGLGERREEDVRTGVRWEVHLVVRVPL